MPQPVIDRLAELTGRYINPNASFTAADVEEVMGLVRVLINPRDLVVPEVNFILVQC